VAGARSADLAIQVARAQLGHRPDLAVILVGANDATHLVRPGEAAAALATAVRRLRDAGTAVVVGTCPIWARYGRSLQPLRQIIGWYGRRVPGPRPAPRAPPGRRWSTSRHKRAGFRADAGMLCHDGFHPRRDGYRVLAYALYPACAAANSLSSIKD
jgi:lysophospholipase L1-like esterase